MTQLPLIARTPASRTTDPESSHAAEAEINRTGTRATQQHVVLRLVHRYPGRTSLELARVSGMERHMLAKRLPELTPHRIQKGESRTCEVGHRKAVTWWPNPE